MEDAHFSALAQEQSGKEDVILFPDNLSPDGLRRLCDKVLQVCTGRCACFSGDDESGYKYAMGQREGDLRALVKELNQTLNGRGGGKPNFVQGSVNTTRAQIEAFFETHL
jgi:alanyl-tRNA synthetase